MLNWDFPIGIYIIQLVTSYLAGCRLFDCCAVVDRDKHRVIVEVKQTH